MEPTASALLALCVFPWLLGSGPDSHLSVESSAGPSPFSLCRWYAMPASLVERARPHDSESGQCMPQKSSAGRSRPPSLEHPSILSTLTVGDEIIVGMLGPGEPGRTEC